MKKLFLLFIFINLFQFSNAQKAANVDTFTIAGANFVATTPADWFSLSVNDSIQKDTTWNYKMWYAPDVNSNAVFAQVWIHVINNTDYVPTKKERKKFERRCKVSQRKIGNWPCYFLNYEGQKMKDCRKCKLVYQQLYSVPLNAKQSLEILFVGQGDWNKLYPLSKTYAQFAENFIRTNDQSLSTFRLINFYMPVTTYNINVGQTYSKVLIPNGFTFHDLTNGNATITGKQMTIHINALTQIKDSTAIQQKIDTNVSIVPLKTYSFLSGSAVAKLVTQRSLLANDGSWILYKFSMDIPQADAAMLEYYKCLLSEYATYTTQHQLDASNSIPAINLQDIDPRKNSKPRSEGPALNIERKKDQLPRPK